MDFNREQQEARQADTDRLNDEALQLLPPKAQDKVLRIRKLVEELREEGSPFYLFISQPAPDGKNYGVTQYNNLLHTFPIETQRITPDEYSAFRHCLALMCFSVVKTFGYDSTDTEQGGWDFVQNFIKIMDEHFRYLSSGHDALWNAQCMYDALNRAWGLDLKPE